MTKSEMQDKIMHLEKELADLKDNINTVKLRTQAEINENVSCVTDSQNVRLYKDGKRAAYESVINDINKYL